MHRLKASFCLFLRSVGVDVALAVYVFFVFVVFLYFSRKVPNYPRGVVHPVKQKLRHPFLPKLKKPIVFAIKLA